MTFFLSHWKLVVAFWVPVSLMLALLFGRLFWLSSRGDSVAVGVRR